MDSASEAADGTMKTVLKMIAAGYIAEATALEIEDPSLLDLYLETAQK